MYRFDSYLQNYIYVFVLTSDHVVQLYSIKTIYHAEIFIQPCKKLKNLASRTEWLKRVLIEIKKPHIPVVYVTEQC